MKDSVRLVCERCGIDFTVAHTTIHKRQSRGNDPITKCVDCRGVTIKAKSKCIPHKGDVCPDTWRPLTDDGKLFRPGVRTCGVIDCVNKQHIINVETIEQVRPASFKGTDTEFVKKVLKEKPAPCTMPNCVSPQKARGWCQAHYFVDYRLRKKTNQPHKDPKGFLVEIMGLVVDTRVCLVPDCGQPVRSKNLCRSHYLAGYRRLRKLRFVQELEKELKIG